MEERGVASDKKGAQDNGATIVFIDESGFSERPPVRGTWAPVGQTPVIRHHFNWKSLGAIGMIAQKCDGSDPRMLIDIEPGSINKDVLVKFLPELHREIEGPVTLLWDSLPGHRSNIVKDQVSQYKDWQIEFLPAYAPELNPVEYLWSALKGHDIANFCSDALWQVEQKISQAADRIGNEPDILRGFLKASTLYDDSTLATSKDKDH
ncbi:MAG: transposase [Armatimonadetes bacterium]|nr:transposase [Armatimonadota bacterium]